MMSKDGDSIAVVYLVCMRLMVAEKLATYHGLKFTVGELVPYKVTVTNVMPMESMPRIIDEASG